MIFPSSFVEFPVVNTNSPACYEASRNEFVLIIFNDGHATLLWHTMNGTHPRAVRYGIDQSGIKELFYFLFDDEVDFWINPPLRLYFRGVVFFESIKACAVLKKGRPKMRGSLSFFQIDKGIKLMLAPKSARARQLSNPVKSQGIRKRPGSPSFSGSFFRTTAEQFALRGVFVNSMSLSLLFRSFLNIGANFGMCMSASAKLSSKCKSRKISINLAARMSSFS
nr:hypothetical protein [Tanacetum cinerariifolium]